MEVWSVPNLVPLAQKLVKGCERHNKGAVYTWLGIWNQNSTTVFYRNLCSYLSISIFNFNHSKIFYFLKLFAANLTFKILYRSCKTNFARSNPEWISFVLFFFSSWESLIKAIVITWISFNELNLNFCLLRSFKKKSTRKIKFIFIASKDSGKMSETFIWERSFI